MRYRGKLYFLLFFLTGLTGLIAESVWQQYLAIVGGGETLSVAIVLAVIMGGSALGAHLAGLRKKSRPFLDFAALEIAIGSWCLLFPLIFVLGQETFSLLLMLLGSNGLSLFLSRLVVALILLAVPATLSGASFPLMAAGVSEESGRLTRVSVPARLYACNTGGGALGALVTGFVFIPALGLHGSIILSGLLDIFAGLTLLILILRLRPRVTGERQGPPGETLSLQRRSSTRTTPQREKRIRPLPLLALTGAVIFALEIVYFRLLSPILDSSSQSFTLMLAVFIAGLALGGAISARLVRGIEKVEILVWQQVLLALAIMGSLLLVDQLPWLLLQLRDGIAASEAGYFSWVLVRVLASALIMLPVSILAGISFPLLLAMVAEDDISLKHVSASWKWNVGGTIIGALGASLGLVPLLGARISLTILGGLAFATALYILLKAGIRQRPLRTKAALALATLVFFVLGGNTLVRSGYEGLFGLAWTLAKNPFATKREYLRALAEHRVLFYKEDDELSVSVTSHKDVRRLSGFAHVGKNAATLTTRTLRVNGKPDASDNINDMSTQLLLAHIPLLLHPSPAQVAVIGLGSGTTSGAVLAHRGVVNLDTIELSRAVVLAARYFQAVNRSCYQDPRSRILVKDAGIHFASSEKKYDVIISEPSHPWMAGVSRLFSADFFSRCKKSLADNGIMAQWVHLAGLSDTTLARIFATFEAVFKNSSIWICNNGDLLMLGWCGERRLPQDLEAKMQEPEVAAQLDSLGIRQRGDFLLREMTTLAALVQKNPQKPFVLTHPELAAIAPVEMFTRKQAHFLSANDQRLKDSGLLLADALPEIRGRSESVLKPFFDYLILHERNFSQLKTLVEALPYRLRDSAVWAALAVHQAEENKLDAALKIWSDILANDQDYIWKVEYADFLLSHTDPRVEAQRQRLKQALDPLDDARAEGELAARGAWVRGQGLARLGEFVLAEKSAYKALSCMQPDERKGVNAGHVYTLLAGIQLALAQDGSDSLGREARLDMAHSLIQQAEILDPENLTGVRQLRLKFNRLSR